MIWLAWKTMIHEKVRLALTLVGIIFATVLVLTQVGIYLGMIGNATAVIRNTDADIWVAAKNIRNFDFANAVPEEIINRVRAMPEVSSADRLIMTWGFLKMENGALEQVQIIGFNPDTKVGAPWNVIEGDPSEVKGGRYMIMDKTSEQRVGSLKTGTLWELSGKRFRLVGLTDGIRSFTTAPVVFMSYKQLQHLPNGLLNPDETTYVVAKLSDVKKDREVVNVLSKSMPDHDVMTRDDFIYRTVEYWTVQTGIGMSFFLTGVMGLMIGGAIVGQTVYATTVQNLREYGTLKAMGATNNEIYNTILAQVSMSAVAGYAIGSLIILAASNSFEKAGVPIYMSGWLLLPVFILIFLTCICSAVFSVRTIKTLDPAIVFRT